MVAHMLKHLDLLKDWLRTRVREFYGTGDGDMGPFSVKSYLEWMLQDTVWGDMICCYLVVSMWGCRISILNGDTCKETRIRHDLPLREADFCLLFNSNVYNGHYSAICRDDQLLLITEKVTPKQGYRKELNVGWERRVKAKELGFRTEGSGIGSNSSSEMVIVSGEMFEGLLKNRELLTRSGLLLNHKQVEVQGVVQRVVQGGSSSRVIEESSQSEMEIDEEVRERTIHRGKTRCDLCQRDFETTRAFKNHYRKMHQGKVRFLCTKCKKGFNTRIGMENHKNKCMEEEKEPTDAVTGQTKTYATLQCETCNKKFVSNSSLKKHVKVFHRPRVEYIKGCTVNPNRITYEYEICKVFKTYWPKKITEHKKKWVEEIMCCFVVCTDLTWIVTL